MSGPFLLRISVFYFLFLHYYFFVWFRAADLAGCMLAFGHIVQDEHGK